jgi:hypothetical protein
MLPRQPDRVPLYRITAKKGKKYTGKRHSKKPYSQDKLCYNMEKRGQGRKGGYL